MMLARVQWQVLSEATGRSVNGGQTGKEMTLGTKSHPSKEGKICTQRFLMQWYLQQSNPNTT